MNHPGEVQWGLRQTFNDGGSARRRNANKQTHFFHPARPGIHFLTDLIWIPAFGYKPQYDWDCWSRIAHGRRFFRFWNGMYHCKYHSFPPNLKAFLKWYRKPLNFSASSNHTVSLSHRPPRTHKNSAILKATKKKPVTGQKHTKLCLQRSLSEIMNLSHFISVTKFRPLIFQNTHICLLADRTPWELIRTSKKGKLWLYYNCLWATVYVRGTNLR